MTAREHDMRRDVEHKHRRDDDRERGDRQVEREPLVRRHDRHRLCRNGTVSQPHEQAEERSSIERVVHDRRPFILNAAAPLPPPPFHPQRGSAAALRRPSYLNAASPPPPPHTPKRWPFYGKIST